MKVNRDQPGSTRIGPVKAACFASLGIAYMSSSSAIDGKNCRCRSQWSKKMINYLFGSVQIQLYTVRKNMFESTNGKPMLLGSSVPLL